ncbi:MAG: hypothetical protein IJ887_05860 [Prevotella sp.]|nr:hypothetical protein [Prevotella sp.]MBR6187630.1 hypothetical protein [Prevotella sp.]
MKKTYLPPLCEVCQMNDADDLLVVSNPATEMELPDKGINKDTDLWDDPDTEDDDWGY